MHASLKNEFTEDKKYHNLMTWLIEVMQYDCQENYFLACRIVQISTGILVLINCVNVENGIG